MSARRPGAVIVCTLLVPLALVGCGRKSGPRTGAAGAQPLTTDQAGAESGAKTGSTTDRTATATEAPATPPPAWSDELAAAAEGSNRFAIALHRRLAADGGNVFFSPFSIHSALAMTAVGARGETFEQLREALWLPEREKLPAAGDLARFYSAADRPYELAVAAALWGQAGVNWEPEFVSTLDTRFGAGFREADFAGDADGERGRINAWVGERTRGRIGTLLPPGAVNELTRLVVASAIAFKGNWAAQFSPAATADAPFRRADGSEAPVPLMHRKGRERHHQGDSFQLLALPYVGREVEMVVLLPRDPSGLAALETRLEAEALAGWIAAAEPVEVAIWLPRFRLDDGFDAVRVLEGMGVTDLFIPGTADLSGMTGTEPLSVSRVIHKAFVAVDEEGTEAAAATAVISNAPSPPPPKPVEFRADRPFLFFIRDALRGTILFVGRYAGP